MDSWVAAQKKYGRERDDEKRTSEERIEQLRTRVEECLKVLRAVERLEREGDDGLSLPHCWFWWGGSG
jgi:hypothetical protein